MPEPAIVSRFAHRALWFTAVWLLVAATGHAEPPAEEPTEDVDWRGLHRLGDDGKRVKKDEPPPNPVTALVQNAPYRIHVVSSDGSKVTITDAFTLERQRVFTGAPVRGYAFSGDGAWLYVVRGAGEVAAVEVQTAKARRLGEVRLATGEAVVEVRGHGTRDRPYVTVVVGRGKATEVGGPCQPVTILRRVRLQQRPGKKVQVITESGPHDLKRRLRSRGTSPNTRMLVELAGGLMSRARLGSKESRLNGKPMPPRSEGLVWMRDSRGVFVLHGRPKTKGCRYGLGLSSYRQPAAQYASWKRQHDWDMWTLPDSVAIVRGDMAHEDPQWAPDGMRLIGHGPRGVVLIEPSPRFRGQVSVIAPPSKLWPVVRPGVRTLASGVGALRLAELLLEQGDIDAAQIEIARAAVPSRKDDAIAREVSRLQARSTKLRAVRERRAIEFGVAAASLRSGSDPAPAPNEAPAPAPAAPKPPATSVPPPGQ